MKMKKTFTIDEEIFKKFDELSKRKSLNKSLFVENCIINYIVFYEKNLNDENSKIKNNNI